MSFADTHHTRSAIFFDIVGNGANPIAPFQCVSYATQAEIDTAVSAGYFTRADAKYGRVVIPTPVGTVLSVTMATRRIVGVTLNAALSGDEVLVQIGGIAQVMCNAVVAAGAVVHAVARATRTTLQTPLTNLPEAKVPFDPRATLTYQFCMIDDPTPTYSSSAANVWLYPLGEALMAATAQYDVIPVDLAQGIGLLG